MKRKKGKYGKNENEGDNNAFVDRTGFVEF